VEGEYVGESQLYVSNGQRLTTVLVVALFALGGCGSDEDDSSAREAEQTETTGSTTSTSTTTTTTATTAEPPTTGSTVVDTVVPLELVHEYHQVRRIDTPSEELRVLIIDEEGSYDFSIEPLGYSETGTVAVTGDSIRFDAAGATEPELTFSGRGEARWTVDDADFGPGTDLTLAFEDGRGYGYDGYDRGVDQYLVADD
jgi:hypothetical protein